MYMQFTRLKYLTGILLAVLVVALAGCQSDSQVSQPRQVDYDLGKYLSSIPREFPEQREFHASDGSLQAFTGYRRGGKQRVAVIYLHGLEGHAGWGRALSEKLVERGYDVFALDRRGSGYSNKSSRKVNGKPVQFEDYVSDVHSFLKPLRAYYQSVYIVGYDWGARLALAYGIAYQGQSRGLVLISPRLIRPGTSLTQKVKSLAGMSDLSERDMAAEFDPELYVTSSKIQAALATDKSRLKKLDENFLRQSMRMSEFIKKYIKRIRQPVQLFLARPDPLVDENGLITLLEKGRQPSFDVQYVDGAKHALQIEAPDRLARDIYHWIRYQELSRNGG
ncbi:MAG TPA: alpha/beta fold hydrolase [Gammaproteobacteria bacterium]|nr:alpha/beta fold hydrolase [Gammaproteobacteria bacterium]